VIGAAVRPRFARWMVRRIEARIRRTFGRVRVRGLDRVRAIAATRPVLLVANHSSWWDAMLVAWLTRGVLGLEGYAMMDADHLRRAPFFVGLGGFGVDRRSRRDGALAIRWAARHLAGPGVAMWIFPQGEERPWHERPLGFHPGAARIARLAPQAAVLPVGLQYAFGAVEKPDAWISIGEPVAPPELHALASAVEKELARTSRGIAGDEEGVDDLLGIRPSRWSGLAERLLALWTRRWLGEQPAVGQEPQPALAPADVASTQRS
jgi:1-acyl-sn-glycerol-3-phosphate acyltransferase